MATVLTIGLVAGLGLFVTSIFLQLVLLVVELIEHD
jgi:hypothetical protein